MANIRRVTGPATEPVTLIEAKSHSRFDDAASDADIAAYLIAARESIERTCSLAMIEQEWDLLIDNAWPCVASRYSCGAPQEIEIPLAPLRSITSISYVDADGITQILAADQYRLVRSGLYNKRGLVVPVYGVSWPAVRYQLEAISVRFKSGFGTEPGDVHEPVRQAIKLLAAHYCENREPINIGSAVTPIPLTISNLLADYVVGGSPDALGGG